MGRNKKDDKKQTITVGIEQSIITALGGEDKTQQFLYESAHAKLNKFKKRMIKTNLIVKTLSIVILLCVLVYMAVNFNKESEAKVKPKPLTEKQIEHIDSLVCIVE